MKSKTATEKDIMVFPWEKDNNNQDKIDLENEILQVEENKKKWAARDAVKKEKAE